MPKIHPDAETMKLATEITKSALGTQGTWIADPDKVAVFIETVAQKITDLRFESR